MVQEGFSGYLSGMFEMVFEIELLSFADPWGCEGPLSIQGTHDQLSLHRGVWTVAGALVLRQLGQLS